ncbi:unnamed protein product, partial [Brachionus calyciflorus]
IPKPASFLSDIFPNVFTESTDDEIDEPTQSTQKKRKRNSQKKSDKTIQESENEDDGEPSIPNSNDREKNKSTPLDALPIALNIDFLLCDLNNFINHVPSWGGRFVDSNTLTRIRLVNTCTIDYFLLGLSCNSCSQLNNVTTKFLLQDSNPLYLIINNSSKLDLIGNELEKEIEVNEDKYVLLFFTIFKQNHYLGVYNINKRLYFIDDLSPRSYKTTFPKLEVVSAFYLKKN